MGFSSRWLATGFFNEPALIVLFWVFAIAVPLSAMLSLLVGGLRGLQRADYMVYVQRGFSEGGRLMLIGAVVAAGVGLLGVSLAYPASLLLGCTASGFLVMKLVEREPTIPCEGSRTISIDRELLRFSFPLMLRDVLLQLRRRLSTLLLGRFADAVQVGLFSAVLPVASVLQSGLNALNRLFLPITSELHARGDTQELKATYRRVARWSFFLTFPLFLTLVTFAKVVLGGLFGAEYRGASTAFIIVCIGFQVNASTGSFGETLMAIGKAKANLLISAVYVSGTLILGTALIPTYGILGASIANSASLIVTSLFGVGILFKSTRLNPWGIPHLKYTIVSLASFLLLYVTVKAFPSGMQQWLLIPMLPLLYGLSVLGMILVQGFDPVEIGMLRSVLRRLRK